MGKHLAIVPARSGSSRIKDKNIYPISGQPMMSYPLKAAKEAGIFDEIHVSTDAPRYADLAGELGFPIRFLRQPEIAENRIGLLDVLRWSVQRYEELGLDIEDVCMVYATAVMLDADDLRRGYEIFKKQDGRLPVLSVATFPSPIERALVIGQDGVLRWHAPEHRDLHSQDCQECFFDTASFFFISRNALLETENYVLSEFLPCILPRWKAVDINEPEDLEVAERLLSTLR